MKKKLLALLQTKFGGVDEAILSRIAEKKAFGVTDESQLPTIVEGIGFQDVLTSYGDFRAGDATTTAVKNYEKKHNLINGKPVTTPPTDPNPDPTPVPDADVPAWAKSLIETNKALSEKLSSFEKETAQQKRNALIMEKAKEHGIPEKLVSMLNISEDADIDTYLKDAKQSFADLGFTGVVSPERADGEHENDSSAIAKMIADGTKKIVEQTNK